VEFAAAVAIEALSLPIGEIDGHSLTPLETSYNVQFEASKYSLVVGPAVMLLISPGSTSLLGFLVLRLEHFCASSCCTKRGRRIKTTGALLF
jgi:hypothetical protein